MRKKRKMIAYLLSMTLMLTSLPTHLFAQDTINTPIPMSALVDAQTTTPGAIQINPNKYVRDDYEVEFKVINQWAGAFQGEFILTNTSDKTLENWTLKFDFEHEITNIWNAQIVTHEANSYIIKNQGYNQDIAPDSSVNIGFQANWNEGIKNPIGYDLLIAKQEVGDTNYTIEFKVTGNWGQAFNGEISITNNTEETIEDWTLEFEFDRNIERFWTAEIVEHEGSHYVIKNAGYNANIAPGQTIILGFNGNSGNIDSKPTNYVLNQIGQEIDYEKDTDSDGLPDWFEKALGTNPNKADTDIDGLLDGYEYFVLGTDFLQVDTNTNGISDADEDFDADGITNMEEYNLGTDPYNEDTDGDNLTDSSENNTYKTNPILYDTDSDGIGDGDEIKLGLDPLNKYTHEGILDSDYTTTQVIDKETLKDINKDNPYEVAITITAAGFADTNIEISESDYSQILIDNDAILGKIISIDYNELKFEEAIINFKIDNRLVERSNLNFPYEEGFKGVQRYQIFRYDEMHGALYPVETEFDIANNELSIHTSMLGEYCIIDMDQWLYSLGIEFPSVVAQLNNMNTSALGLINTEEPTVSVSDEPEWIDDELPSNYEELVRKQITNICHVQEVETGISMQEINTNVSTYASYNKQIELVFVIDTSGSMSNKINQCKNYMKTLVQNLYNEGITSRVSVISFNDKGEPIVTYKLSAGDVWGKNPSEASQLISQITNVWGGSENHGDALEEALNLSYRTNTAKFAVLLTDEPYNANDNNSKITASGIASKLANKGIITSVICSNYDASSFKPIYELTNGIQISISSNFNTYLEIFIKTVMRENNTFLAVVPNSLTTISLKTTPRYNTSIDSDKDGLTDSEEIDWTLINWDYNTDTLMLPTINEYLNYIKAKDVETFKRLSKEKAKIINAMVVLPIKSNPAKEDSDADGLLDGNSKIINGKTIIPKDPQPLKTNGPIGIWGKQYEQEKLGNIPHSLTNKSYISEIDVKLLDFNILHGKVSIKVTINDREIIIDSTKNPKECYTIYRDLLYGGAQIGSQILNFKLDDKEMALHSQVKTWQWLGGYNDIYDAVFRFGTNGNMDNVKFPFKDARGDDYILWAWQGDYLNLGSGAEIGIYEKPIEVPFTDFKHWLCPDFTLPMTLNLYNYYTTTNVEKIFCWAPYEKQWWITGFNPDFNQPNVEKMVSVGTIDFKGHEDMFKSLKTKTTVNEKLKDFMIFDEDGHTVWFIWWTK